MSQFLKLIRLAGSDWVKDNASRHGAALAYYSAFSIGPMLLIVTALTAFVFGQEAVQGRVVLEMQRFLGQEGAEALQSILQGAKKDESEGIWATVIGVLALLVTASGVVYQLKSSLNEMWGLEPDPERSFWWTVKDRLLSVAGVLGLGFIMVVSLVASALVSAFSENIQYWIQLPEITFRLLNLGVSLLVLILLFALMFRFLPDARIRWQDTLAGAALTGVLFVLGKWLIGWYLGSKGLSSAYGAAGSLMIILLWVYYSAQIFFFGAELTQVYTRLYGEPIQAGRGAVLEPDNTPTSQEPRGASETG